MIKREIKYGDKDRNVLDVIYDAQKEALPLVIFIHGGSWMTGSKDMYARLGENLLPEGYVSVLINYRLFPVSDVYGMSDDCSAALAWCVKNIAGYGGDPKKIFLMGHSAGGHLAAVTALRHDDNLHSLKGVVLVDAFGLSAYHFLSVHGHMVPDFFAGVFGRNSERWPLASPDKLLKENAPPMLVLTGGSTYPFLAFDNENFISLLKTWGVKCEHRLYPSKTHMQMIYEYDNRNSRIFRETVEWLNNTNK